MLVVSASLGDGGADVKADALKLRRDKSVSICYNVSTNRRIRRPRIHALFYVPGPPDLDILAFFQSSVDALPFARDTHRAVVSGDSPELDMASPAPTRLDPLYDVGTLNHVARMALLYSRSTPIPHSSPRS